MSDIHRRKHNPWNEIECGDHYARAMASWGVLVALEDYFYNGPEKRMRFAPKIQQEQFDGFFSAAEGWGNISQKQTAHIQQNEISVSYGKLRLKSLEVDVISQPKKVKLFSGSKEIPSSMEYYNRKLTLRFDEVQVIAGEPLRLVASY